MIFAHNLILVLQKIMTIQRQNLSNDITIETKKQLFQLLNDGQYVEVLNLGASIIERFSYSPSLHSILGLTFLKINQIHKSIYHLEIALKLKPNCSQSNNYLGLALTYLKKYKDAEIHLLRAVKLNPNYHQAINNLGILYQNMEDFDKAIIFFNKATKINKYYFEAYNNIGIVYNHLGNYSKSKENFIKAISINSKFSEALNNLGATIYENYFSNGLKSESLHEAAEYLTKATEINPCYAEAFENLANIYFVLKEYQPAIKNFKSSLKFKPLSINSFENLINSLKHEGLIDEAYKFLEKEALNYDNEKIKINYTSIVYRILPTKNDIYKQRDRLIKLLDSNYNEQIRSKFGICYSSKVYPFYLSYDGLSTKQILEKQGEFFQNKLPEINLYKGDKNNLTKKKIKVGFFTKYLSDHPISYCFLDIFLNLDQNYFDLYIFSEDIIGKNKIIKENDGKILSNVYFKIFEKSKFEKIRDAILDTKLDIMVYPEAALTVKSYYLAAHRLAKYQVALGGHPDTTGLNTVDYFISNKFNEPDNAQNNYTENLVLFDNMFISGSLDQSLKYIPKHLSFSDFEIPEGKKYYGCLQSLFKIHPDFDVILNDIISLDPDALFVFTIFPNKLALKQLLERWQKYFPNIIKHSVFLERLPHLSYLRVVELMDLHLDTIHFGMGSTAQQTLQLQKPIVSWPGSFMRGRVVSSIYEKFNFRYCPLVKDKSNYAKIAVEWANNKKLKNKFAKEISEKFNNIFPKTNNISSEFENFFKKLFEM